MLPITSSVTSSTVPEAIVISLVLNATLSSAANALNVISFPTCEPFAVKVRLLGVGAKAPSPKPVSLDSISKMPAPVTVVSDKVSRDTELASVADVAVVVIVKPLTTPAKLIVPTIRLLSPAPPSTTVTDVSSPPPSTPLAPKSVIRRVSAFALAEAKTNAPSAAAPKSLESFIVLTLTVPAIKSTSGTPISPESGTRSN